jgi:hypothetical protein
MVLVVRTAEQISGQLKARPRPAASPYLRPGTPGPGLVPPGAPRTVTRSAAAQSPRLPGVDRPQLPSGGRAHDPRPCLASLRARAGDPVIGGLGVDTAGAQLRAGAVGVVAGNRGLGEPARPRQVDTRQIASGLVRLGGLGRGLLGGVAEELDLPVVKAGGSGAGVPDGGVAAGPVSLLVHGGQVVVDVAGRPGLLSL